MPKFNFERAATILAEAVFSGDVPTAKKHGVTTRSIEYWRKRLDTDEVFSAFFEKKREALEHNWISDAPAMLRAAMTFLKRASEIGDPENPDQVKAIAESLKIVSSVLTTKQVIDARLAEPDRSRSTAN